MDKAAMGLAMENNVPITVFDVFKKDNLSKLIAGESVGTSIQ
jgi:uridylate kinase